MFRCGIAVGARGTVMAGLIESGVYDETVLSYSENMNVVVSFSTFDALWIY
jgi:exo-1,4-beta-D-glucosaminidase